MIQSHFKSKGFVQGNVVVNAYGHPIDLSTFPPFLRTLLLTDGTVTKSIEAFYWEPVQVVRLQQQIVKEMGRHSYLRVEDGYQYLHRTVKLCGDNSQRIYASADSYIDLDLLPKHTAQRLVDNKIGIGEVLREEGVESYREIMDLGVDSGDSVLCLQGDVVAYRQYVIYINDKPAIDIKEWFPIELYGSSAN